MPAQADIRFCSIIAEAGKRIGTDYKLQRVLTSALQQPLEIRPVGRIS